MAHQPSLEVPVRVVLKDTPCQAGQTADKEEWTICHRLVVPHPEYDEGSLELLWERQGENQRIALYTGPDSPIRSLHFTLRLPSRQPGPLMSHLNHPHQRYQSSSRMVLTRFASDKYPILCCLLDSHTLVLFDIYPDKSASNPLPSEGWTIPLPFECTSIFSAHPGLLLQRQEDFIEIPATPVSAPSIMENWKHHIPAPPLGGQGLETTTGTQTLSLFSLHHHLEDILPVEMRHPFTPREDVVWAGILQNDTDERRFIVTHQMQRNAHFGRPTSCFKIYRVDDMPPPPEKPPLYQQIRERYDTTQRFDSSLPHDLLLFDKYWHAEEPESVEPATGPKSLSVHTNVVLPEVAHMSRDQALASALGVKTPRSPTDHNNESSSSSSFYIQTTSSTLHAKLKTTLVHSVSIANGYDGRDGTSLHVFALNDMVVLQSNGTLRLLRMTATGGIENVIPFALDDVVAAQPINGGHQSNRWLMLVLRSSSSSLEDSVAPGSGHYLELYRADRVVGMVSVNGIGKPLIGIRDAVGDRVTVDPVGRIAISLQTDQEDILAVTGFDKELELALRVDLYQRKGDSPDSWLTLRTLLLSATMAALDSEHDMNARSATETLILHRTERTLVLTKLFDALHLLSEELKLGGQGRHVAIVRLLAEMLRIYKQAYGESSLVLQFEEYYGASNGPHDIDFSTLNVQPQTGGVRISTFTAPPSIFGWIENTIKATCEPQKYIGLDFNSIDKEVYPLTRAVLRCYTVLFNERSSFDDRRKRVVEALLDEGFSHSQDVQERLLPGVALPLIEVILHLRNTASVVQSTSWHSTAWDLIGRPDLSKNSETSILGHNVFDRNEHLREGSVENDGLVELETQASMIFPDDNRIREAAHLLRSSRPVVLSVDRPVEASDHDYEALKQRRLLVLCFRAISLPVGRGMLTLGNHYNPPVTELLPIPQLCLKGRLLPTNVTVNLEVSECPPEFMIWPNFHNGVAAGLRLPLGEETDSSFRVTRSWIRFNRPPSVLEEEEVQATHMAKQDAHAGLLLALGLRGQLDCLEMTDVYEYLTQGAVTTTVGLLLGLAANKRGSCDIQASKMMSLHIPSLIPQHFSAIDVASPVQTAAVTSSGLLYQGSGHRMMTEFLLNEIGRRPDSDVSTVDRESYSLACGIALGTVNLGHGKFSNEKTAGLADLNIEERLIRYVVGGVDPDEQRRTREATDRFSLRSVDNDGEAERCSTVYEGKEINTNVCAPGAILALGLMFVKSSNTSIASRLKLPDTHFLLEFVRPDFITLLIVSRCLIMWDEVKPTNEWIQAQIPDVVLDARSHMMSRAKQSLLGKAHAGTDSNYDCRAVRQMYVHALSGACFAIGIRFAGTGNEVAKEALMERVKELHKLRTSSDPTMAALRPEIPILETCLGCATISLAMVMAGTGALDVFRLLRVLRWDCSEESRYGVHMAYGMAIGLLFLGGGQCTLGREPEDIAAILMAFFPRFPLGTFDNQFHLQALRHLYVLATKPRVLQPIDVDTGKQVSTKVRLSSATGKWKELQAPSLLLNDEERWQALEIVSPEYYPLKLAFPLKTSQLMFYVKRRKSEKLCSQLVSSFRNPRSLCLNSFKKVVLAKDPATSFSSRIHDQADRLSAEEILPIYLRLRYGEGLTGESLNVLRHYLRWLKSDDHYLDDRLLVPFLQEVAIHEAKNST